MTVYEEFLKQFGNRGTLVVCDGRPVYNGRDMGYINRLLKDYKDRGHRIDSMSTEGRFLVVNLVRLVTDQATSSR